jgi:hypothetical protein
MFPGPPLERRKEKRRAGKDAISKQEAALLPKNVPYSIFLKDHT